MSTQPEEQDVPDFEGEPEPRDDYSPAEAEESAASGEDGV